MKASSTQNTVETVENGTRPAVKKNKLIKNIKSMMRQSLHR